MKLRSYLNKKFKKYMAVVVVAGLAGSGLIGCNVNDATGGDGKIKVVCTIFPEYDWVMNLIKGNEEKYDVTLLIDNGTDLHSYQASAKDIMTIENCDLFVYVGGESDNWVKDVLKEHQNPERTDINLMEVLGDKVYCEEIIEGMQSEEEEADADNAGGSKSEDAEKAENVEEADFGTEDVSETEDAKKAEGEEEADSDEEETEYDEHVWLSLKNAQIICSKLTEELKLTDKTGKHASEYDKALEEYLEDVTELDRKYSEAVADAKSDMLLFGDRFPFRYMTEDYGLKYYAAFPGCSAETEASFETVVFLAGVLDDNNISKICVTETSDQNIAKTIIENSKNKNAEIVVFDSMQSVTGDDIKKGASYISYMESNLKALKEALS